MRALSLAIVKPLGDALLHQQARAGAADLALVEPDRIDQPSTALSRSASSNTM
jgi:hypothetical protein